MGAERSRPRTRPTAHPGTGPRTPRGGPADVPRDLWEAFSRPGLDPDAPALGELTRREAVARVEELAERLRAAGVRPGESVGLHGPNQPEWVVGLLALTAAGACPLLLPADAPPAEVRRLSRAVGAARRLLTDGGTRIEEGGDAGGGDAEGGPVGGDGLVGACHEPGTLLLASSGSTGTPKAVARTPASVIDEGLRYHRAGLALPDDSVLLPLPLSHAYALGWLAGALVAGAHADPVPPRAVGAVHARLRQGATVLVTVPGLARVLARRRALAEDAPYPALRRVMAGAGYVDAELDALWTRALGIGVSRNFGSSETGAVLWGDPGLPSGAVGHPMPGVRVDLLGPDGEPLPGPAQGELAVVLEDGSTHRMHDLAERDEHGVHRILGRARRGVVRRGARWVSTLEVESVLRGAPGVADVSVTATGPDDSDDQGLTVEYVPADAGLAAPERVQAYARAQLAAHKVPDAFLPRYRLRRSAVGKAQAAPVYRLARPAGDTAERVLAAALTDLGLPPRLSTGATAADLARTDTVRAEVLIPLLDTACALGLLGTDTGAAVPAEAWERPTRAGTTVTEPAATAVAATSVAVTGATAVAATSVAVTGATAVAATSVPATEATAVPATAVTSTAVVTSTAAAETAAGRMLADRVRYGAAYTPGGGPLPPAAAVSGPDGEGSARTAVDEPCVPAPAGPPSAEAVVDEPCVQAASDGSLAGPAAVEDVSCARAVVEGHLAHAAVDDESCARAVVEGHLAHAAVDDESCARAAVEGHLAHAAVDDESCARAVVDDFLARAAVDGPLLEVGAGGLPPSAGAGYDEYGGSGESGESGEHGGSSGSGESGESGEHGGSGEYVGSGGSGGSGGSVGSGGSGESGGYGACVVVGGVHDPVPRLGALAALLSPGGLLVLADAFVADARVLPDGASRTAAVRWLAGGRLHWWTVPELQAGLESVGLRVEESRAVGAGAWSVVIARKPA
ncbi:AMP-binding protein [Streptomyces sp. NPDC088812]|uniref:AMP-binding protein n=1 Tax=Streptomyces sp. NPDC088812 TaxID=3365905 RepID=UPI003828664B